MQALTTGRSTTKARHIRFRCRLVEEDKTRRVEAALVPPPSAPRPGDIFAVLFAGPERLFLYVSPMFSSA